MAPGHRHLLDLLLAQDGSTTRLCETIAGGAVGVRLLRQETVERAPEPVREWLPGRRYLERVTALVAHGEVLMDNLSYTALDGLEADIETDLRAGTLPIGHLLARWWVRRAWIADSAALAQRLWEFVGLPDAAATRAYAIVTPQGPRMVIAETYRRGMVGEAHVGAASIIPCPEHVDETS